MMKIGLIVLAIKKSNFTKRLSLKSSLFILRLKTSLAVIQLMIRKMNLSELTWIINQSRAFLINPVFGINLILNIVTFFDIKGVSMITFDDEKNIT